MPQPIFIVDETGFGKGVIDNVCTGNKQSLTRQIVTTNHSTAMTCLVFFSAAGQILPSFIIYERCISNRVNRYGRIIAKRLCWCCPVHPLTIRPDCCKSSENPVIANLLVPQLNHTKQCHDIKHSQIYNSCINFSIVNLHTLV